jgi:oligopeptide transport system permease protein
VTGRIVSRLVQGAVVIWVIYTITFVLVIQLPGNPFERTEGRAISPVIERALRQRYGMESNWQFYVNYLEGMLKLDFGESLFYRDWTCNQIIASSLPVSMALGAWALFLALTFGVLFGVAGAVYRYHFIDYVTLLVAIVGVSVPSFVIGAGLLIVFGIMLGWAPVGGWGTLNHVWLPGIALSLPFMAYIARLTRLGMLDVLSSDYIRTARAKGCAPGSVVWKHALKNAFLPVLSFLGPAAAYVMTGSFVIEKVFNIPGLGTHFVQSVLNKDQMLILAVVMVLSGLIVIFNLIVDIAYGWLDPRIGAEAT